MAYIFEENNFKSHLHRNCKRSWFLFGESCVQYEDRGGIHSANPARKVIIQVSGAIRDPSLNKTKASVVGVYSQMQKFTAGAAVLAAPFTGGASLAVAALSGGAALAWEAAEKASSNEASRPEDVYFTLNSDSSDEWVAKSISPGDVWQAANDVVQWSNQVFRERYVEEKSSQFQTYIAQRPPTPGNWPPSSSW